jgi:hypothetical protein
MKLAQANATAQQHSRHVAVFTGRNDIIEVRQVSASEFTYVERGFARGEHRAWVLVGAYQNGKSVA